MSNTTLFIKEHTTPIRYGDVNGHPQGVYSYTKGSVQNLNVIIKISLI